MGAVVIVVGLISAPLITLLLYRTALSIAASFMELVGSVGGVRLFSAFRSAEDTLIATYAMLSIVSLSLLMDSSTISLRSATTSLMLCSMKRKAQRTMIHTGM